MAVRTEQQKIRDLLTEAITVLCKNGLTFNSKFSVEGLLGITLDNHDIFLVNINQTVRSNSNIDDESNEGAQAVRSGDESAGDSPHRRSGATRRASRKKRSSTSHAEPAFKKSMISPDKSSEAETAVKDEPLSENDIVIIKEETEFDENPQAHSSWQHTQHMAGDMRDQSNTGFTGLLRQSNTGWKQNYSNTEERGTKNAYCTWQTAAQSQPFSNILYQPTIQDESVEPKYTCNICGAIYSSRQPYRYHVDSHQQTQSCESCGKVLKSRSNYYLHKRTCTAIMDSSLAGVPSSTSVSDYVNVNTSATCSVDSFGENEKNGAAVQSPDINT